MIRKPVFSSKAPKPKGIYSPGIVAQGRFLFVSGQIPVDPVTQEMQLGDIKQQTERTFGNIGLLLDEAGSSWDHVVKVNVYLADMADFSAMNDIYKQFFKEPYPARTTIGAALPIKGMLIEIDCIALVP